MLWIIVTIGSMEIKFLKKLIYTLMNYTFLHKITKY